MKIGNKGVIEIQFKWIYIGIVGTVIMLVSGTIVFNLTRSGEEITDIDSEYYLEVLFSDLYSSSEAEHNISLSSLEVEFDTAKNSCNFFRTRGSLSQGKSIGHIPLFSPKYVKDTMLTYSKSWRIPFNAGNFLFITDSGTQYVFVGGNENMQSYLPEKMKKISVSNTQSLQEQDSYYRIRFVSFSPSHNPSQFSLPSWVSSMPDEQVSGVQMFLSSGRVIFFKKEGNKLVEDAITHVIPDIEDPTWLAVLYSENKDSYECNMLGDVNTPDGNTKALRRSNFVARILRQRAEKIRNSDKLPSKCMQYDSRYREGEQHFREFLDITDNMLDSGLMRQDHVTSLKRVSNELLDVDSNLDSASISCPTLVS